MVKGFIFFRDGKMPFVIENYRMELFTDDSLLDNFCKEYNFKENYILHGQCFDTGIGGRKATFWVENSMGSTCYLRCYIINMFGKDKDYDAIGLQSPSLDEVFRYEYEYIDMVRSGINLALEPMSEFSKEAVDAITSNLDDIRRRLSLNIEGDSLESVDGEILVPLKELEEIRIAGGTNILLYGVPGSGKSWTIEHEYCHQDSVVERLVFHPDYTNADFIGQILPVVDTDKQVTYEFTPGPFTTIIRDAYRNPMREYILIIEEVNRGNAPAIFGEVFQLLDRTLEPKKDHEVVYPAGTSEYGITNRYMATVIYGDGGHEVRIPSNLSVIGTMNTSDQNVFTLDTAYQRRWNMRLIENTFENVRPSLANAKILDTDVTWETFCTTVNKLVVGNRAKMASAEDKRLGVYFVHESDLEFDDRAISPDNDLRGEYNVLLKAERDGNLTPEQKGRLYDIREALKKIRKFPEKVIKYLWDDAFKFNPEALFDTDNMESLEQVIRTFVYSTGRDRFKIFKPTVRSTFYPDSQA